MPLKDFRWPFATGAPRVWRFEDLAAEGFANVTGSFFIVNSCEVDCVAGIPKTNSVSMMSLFAQGSLCREPVCFGSRAKKKRNMYPQNDSKTILCTSTFVLPIMEVPSKLHWAEMILAWVIISTADEKHPLVAAQLPPTSRPCDALWHLWLWLPLSASERWKVFLSLLLMPRINSSTHCGPTNIVTCEVNADNVPLSCLCLRDTFDFCSATRRHVGVRRHRSSQCWWEAQLRKTGQKKQKNRLHYAVVCNLELRKKWVMVEPLVVE